MIHKFASEFRYFGTQENGLYSDWEPGQPNDSSFLEAQDCAVIDVNTGKWYDSDCDTERDFVCEVANGRS